MQAVSYPREIVTANSLFNYPACLVPNSTVTALVDQIFTDLVQYIQYFKNGSFSVQTNLSCLYFPLNATNSPRFLRWNGNQSYWSPNYVMDY